MKNFSILLTILFAVSLSQTNDNYYEVKLTMETPSFGQFFGGSIGIESNLVVIAGEAAVHYYQLIDGTWIEIQSMTNDDIQYNLSIYDISISNSQVAYCLGGGGFLPYESNRIYVNYFDGALWQRDTVITIDDMNDASLVTFGNSVALYENRLLVMAKTSLTTRVYLFEKVDENWQMITYFEKDISEYFGDALTLDNEFLCMGAVGYEVNFEHSGAVYCYQYNGSNWIESPRITSPEPGYNFSFGAKVMLLGRFLFVSEVGNLYAPDFPGKVHIYRKNGITWDYITQLNASDAMGQDMFGFNISAWGDHLVIGAWKNDDGGTVSGSAYIFEQIENTDGEISWIEKKKIISSDLALGDQFGGGVGISENFVMISAPAKDNFSGAVYVYDPHDTSLHANFAADVRNGNAPVTVQFTSVPQGNPTAYEWDFNSDGFIDSTDPHPQFTYQINGVYTVTLTVYDETGIDDEVKTGYIQVLSDILFGDVDQSGELDVGDLVLFVAFVLGDAEPDEDQFIAGDVNYSGQIDIIDIVMVIHEILGY